MFSGGPSLVGSAGLLAIWDPAAGGRGNNGYQRHRGRHVMGHGTIGISWEYHGNIKEYYIYIHYVMGIYQLVKKMSGNISSMGISSTLGLLGCNGNIVCDI